jgi:tRNA-specific 2-thiouridylase
VKEYWNDVFTPFLDLYKSGVRTPNPDVLCNRFVKFHHLRNFVSTQLGIPKLATGHYARVIQHPNGGQCPLLLRGVDPIKDQSFFLSLVKVLSVL